MPENDLAFLGFLKRLLTLMNDPSPEMVAAGNEAIMTFASVEYVGTTAAKAVFDAMLKAAIEGAKA